MFAGAGVSLPAPAGLPLFNDIRDALLDDLSIRHFEGLVPEPFFLALREAGVEIGAWLREVLSGKPNLVHRVLATVADQGARVWTVNFDELIEAAAPVRLDVCAWPDAPRSATLFKPHGTLSGDLIIGADQVLTGLRDDWAAALARDVAGRVAVFVGYSGRDLDFRPLWHDILPTARRVVWFARPDPDAQSMIEQSLGVPVDFHSHDNPSRAFVEWCASEGFVAIDADDLSVLDHRPSEREWPRLRGARGIARGGVLELLGDIRGARAQYAKVLLVPTFTGRSGKRLANLTLGHGGRLVAAVLRAAVLLPSIGPLASARRRASRKRINVLLNMGKHRRVLAATEDAEHSLVSTELILRAGTVRYLGSLDDAARLATAALDRARDEHHNVRAANAAFQIAIAQLWAGRPDAAAAAVATLTSLAALAAARWVAWSEWATASLRIYRGQDCDETLRLLSQAQARFAAEGLSDGVISALTVRLTALRQARDIDGYRSARLELDQEMTRRGRGVVYYSRGHRFTAEAIAFEDGEFARSTGHPETASDKFEFVAASDYSIHRALGLLGLAATADDAPRRQRLVAEAARVARAIAADGIEQCALDMPTSGEVPPLLFP